MNKRIVDRILENAGREKEHGRCIFFSDPRYAAAEFSKSNFKTITKETKSSKKPAMGRKLAFVDGGNSEIIGAPDFSLQLIRIYYSIWQNNKRIKYARDDFFIFVNAAVSKEKGHGKMKYCAEIFKKEMTTKSIIEEELRDQLHKSVLPDKADLIYDSMDGTITDGINRAKPSKIGEIARRFAEIKACGLAIDNLSEGDAVVIDGTLQSSVTNEGKQLHALYEKAIAKKVFIAALSKTNSLLTETGNSASFIINKMAPKGAWLYHPVVNIMHPDHKAEMFIVKLHSGARHVFRLEIQKDQYLANPSHADEIISLLSENSIDPVFLGYPYGLIEADRFARIPLQEGKSLRMQLMLSAGDKMKELLDKMSANDAHEILDNIGY